MHATENMASPNKLNIWVNGFVMGMNQSYSSFGYFLFQPGFSWPFVLQDSLGIRVLECDIINHIFGKELKK